MEKIIIYTVLYIISNISLDIILNLLPKSGYKTTKLSNKVKAALFLLPSAIIYSSLVFIAFILGNIKGTYRILLLIIAIINLIILYYLFTNTKSCTHHHHKTVIQNTQSKPMFKYPSVIYAQILLETGHFKSKLYSENNNLFGMKFPKQRETTAIQEKNGYAYYSSLESCLKDRLLWDETYAAKIDSKEEYYKLLGKVYAGDASYIEKLKRLEKYYQPL